MALPGEKPVKPKYKEPDETSRIYERYPIIKMKDIPPTISKVPKEKAKPTPIGPMPDYLAPAEAHREELRRQAEMELLKETPIGEYREVSFAPTIVYDPLVDVDGVPTTYAFTEEERKRSRKSIDDLLKAEEAFFGLFEEPLLKKSEELEEKSLELAKKGESLPGLAAYIGGVGAYSGAQFIGGATLVVRPLLIKETGETIYSLIADPKARKAFISEVAQDPFKFLAGTGAGVAGGYITGKVVSKAIGPRTYALKKTKVPRKTVTESPASLMPRGEWPKGWGGTPVLLLDDPSLVEVMKPIPKYVTTPQILLGLTGGLTGIPTLDKEVVDQVSDALLYDKPDFPGSQITPQIIKPTITKRQRERVEPGYILPPSEIEREIQKVLPGYRARPKPLTHERTVEKEIQKDVQMIALSLKQFEKTMSKTDFKFDRPLTRKEDRRRPKRSLEMWGEARRYPVAERKKFFKKLLSGLL